jgi:hypothetical protein
MNRLVQELKRRWVAMPEVVEYTGLSYNLACRLIDKISDSLFLAETVFDGFTWFKVMTDEDYRMYI